MAEGNGTPAGKTGRVFIVTGYDAGQVFNIAEEVSKSFPGNPVVLAPETVPERLPESGKHLLFGGKPGTRSHSLKSALHGPAARNSRSVVILESGRIRNAGELLRKLDPGKEVSGITFLMDESALIRENSRNPVFQIFRNFLFWIETGFRITLQKAPIVEVSSGLLSSLKMSPFKEGTKKEIIVRSIWKARPDIIPVSSMSVRKPSGKKPVRSAGNSLQLFLLHTWLLLKSAFYIQPKSAISLFTVKNLKNFIRKELFNPAEPAHIKAISVGIGVFCGIIPLWGWQTILAITLSLALRINKIITITASSVSITPLLPLILYFSYFTGGFFIGDRPTFSERQSIDLEFIKVHFLQYFIGAFVFALVAGFVTGLFTFGVLKLAPRRTPDKRSPSSDRDQTQKQKG